MNYVCIYVSSTTRFFCQLVQPAGVHVNLQPKLADMIHPFVQYVHKAFGLQIFPRKSPYLESLRFKTYKITLPLPFPSFSTEGVFHLTSLLGRHLGPETSLSWEKRIRIVLCTYSAWLPPPPLCLPVTSSDLHSLSLTTKSVSRHH